MLIRKDPEEINNAKAKSYAALPNDAIGSGSSKMWKNGQVMLLEIKEDSLSPHFVVL